MRRSRPPFEARPSEYTKLACGGKPRCRFTRTIAKSGGLTAEAGDGLCWAEGTGLGSQGHGHPEGKPSLQSQGVQRNVDQRGVYLAQPRDGAACGRPHPNCGPSHGAGCSPPPSGCGTLEAVPWDHTAGNSGCSADTSAPGSPPRCRCQPSPSPPSLPASPREIPTHPGYTQPAHHQSRCAVSRSLPLFFDSLRLRLSQFLQGKPVGHCLQYLGLVPLDTHQVVPSVADYAAWHRFRVQGVHGQSAACRDSGLATWANCSRHPRLVPFLLPATLVPAQPQVMGSTFTITKGFPPLSWDAWPTCRPRRQVPGPPPPGPPTRQGPLAHKGSQGARDGGGVGWMRNPRGSLSAGHASWRTVRCGPWWSDRRPNPAG